MAVTKLWPVKNKVENVANYDINPLKTTYDEEIMPRGVPVGDIAAEPYKGLLIDGINCSPATAIDEFSEVKRKFGKEGGILAYHGFISFPDTDGLDPVNVLAVAKEAAIAMWGNNFQVILAVHTNTKTLHCHMLTNSVSFVDGHKASDNEKNYYRLKGIVDEICKKYDLTVPVPNTREPLDYEALKAKLIKIRMASPDIPSLKANLEKENLQYCGANYIRVKDGRFVRLSQIDQALKDLFRYPKGSDTALTEPSKKNTPANVQSGRKSDREIGRV